MDADAPNGKAPAARRKFTPEEDMQMRSLVERLGTKSWEEISRFLPDRSARQCRDRYKNYLVDSLMTTPWTPEEDALVIAKFHQIGPKWVEIGKLLSGRSGNNVKNRWHKHLVKLDIGAPPCRPEPKRSLDLAVGIGWTETDWRQLLATGEDSVQVASSWSRGFSLGDPLF
jgi:hypothetical protein